MAGRRAPAPLPLPLPLRGHRCRLAAQRWAPTPLLLHLRTRVRPESESERRPLAPRSAAGGRRRRRQPARGRLASTRRRASAKPGAKPGTKPRPRPSRSSCLAPLAARRRPHRWHCLGRRKNKRTIAKGSQARVRSDGGGGDMCQQISDLIWMADDWWLGHTGTGMGTGTGTGTGTVVSLGTK